MKLWVVSQHYGGISSASKKGVTGSFYFGQSLDYRSDPDILQTQYAATKVSGTVAVDRVQWIEPVESDVYFLGNAGNLYYRTGGTGTFTSAGSVSLCTGQGMGYYSDNLYIAGGTKMARYGSISSGTPALTDPWTPATSIQNDTWHPMANFVNYLCVGNGRYLSTYDGTTWTYNTLTLPAGYKIRSLAVITGKFLAIGAWQGNNIYDSPETKIFLWDGTATTYNDIIDVNEGGINAMMFHQSTLWIWAGAHGNLYSWNGNLIKVKRVVRDLEAGKYAETFPGAASVWNGLVHFGISNSDSTTAYRGVYTYGQLDKNYPNSLNFEYPISSGTVQGTAVIVGACKGIGPSQFYIGWQNGTVYGVDQVSSTNKYGTARFESLIFDNQQPYKQKYGQLVKVTNRPLASGEAIAIEYKLDNSSSWTALGTVSYSADGAVTEKRFPIDWRAKEFQMAMAITGTAGTVTMPKICSLEMLFSEEDWI